MQCDEWGAFPYLWARGRGIGVAPDRNNWIGDGEECDFDERLGVQLVPRPTAQRPAVPPEGLQSPGRARNRGSRSGSEPSFSGQDKLGAVGHEDLELVGIRIVRPTCKSRAAEKPAYPPSTSSPGHSPPAHLRPSSPPPVFGRRLDHEADLPLGHHLPLREDHSATFFGSRSNAHPDLVDPIDPIEEILLASHGELSETFAQQSDALEAHTRLQLYPQEQGSPVMAVHKGREQGDPGVGVDGNGGALDARDRRAERVGLPAVDPVRSLTQQASDMVRFSDQSIPSPGLVDVMHHTNSRPYPP